jgi:dihydrolipoamide dehydrogenase
MNKYDAAVVGACPGGYVSAIRLAQLGLKTVITERAEVGGTCLNTGCIPTKTLIKNAQIIREIGQSAKRGLKTAKPEIDMRATMAMKDKVIARLAGGVRSLLKSNGVELIAGEAELLSENRLLAAGREIVFDNLIIATGAENYMPPIPGLDQKGIMTSAEMLALDHVPDRLAIIGGGVIGCEMATIFNSFGSEVTIIEVLPDILPSMDKDVSEALRKSLRLSGVKVLSACALEEVSGGPGGYALRIAGSANGVIEADCVLVSVGRRPNLKGLQRLDLRLEGARVEVDERMRTGLKGVYAVGDVTGKLQLAHAASAQGTVAAENIAGGRSVMSYDAVPSCVYTIPEIGAVGLTEAEAKAAREETVVGKFPMAACGMALAMGAASGFTKLIADKKSGEILGCHIIGPNAAEIIGEAAAAMRRGDTLHDFGRAIRAHPTIGETLTEAARLALGEPIHAPKHKESL